MSKQTAVEWLMNQIMEGSMDTKTGDLYIKLPKHSFQQAKAMEREQMIDAYSNGWHDGQDAILQQCKHIDKGGDDAGSEYYNKTYKGNSNKSAPDYA